MDNRLSKLRVLIKKEKLDAVLISNLSNITYLTNFSGFSTEDRDAFLLITNTNQYIFTHGIYKEAVKKYINKFTLLEMTRENPISSSLKKLTAEHKIRKIGFESFDLRVSEYNQLLKLINKKIVKPTNIINNLRIIKTSDETEAIKKACALGDKAYSDVLENIRIEMTEKEVAFEIENFIRKNKAVPSFPTIVAFGENAAHPHHVPTDKKLAKDTFVLMDFGVKLGNYCSDMTRTIFFGRANSEQKNVYETVLGAQNIAIETLNSYFLNLNSKSKALSASSIDNVARNYITKQNFPTIPHSLGHGIGLEVHESPSLSLHSKDLLKEGMVFSIEPGIYIPEKIGIRIEDLFAIENNKLIQLTNSPQELLEI